MSGAFLQYGSTRLFDSPSNVTLTVGATERLFCTQPEAAGPVPTSIEWYNPQDQLVTRDGGDAVNQQAAGGGRIAHLNFHSYQQSQGGKYECRVAGAGNNLKRLPVCISECHIVLLTVKPVTCDSGVFLAPSIYHLYYVHTIQIAIVVTSLGCVVMVSLTKLHGTKWWAGYMRLGNGYTWWY